MAGVNGTAIAILLAIFVPVCATAAAIVVSFCRLQRHCADAVAMASYRKLAEEAVARQAELLETMQNLTRHVGAVEQMMRDVG